METELEEEIMNSNVRNRLEKIELFHIIIFLTFFVLVIFFCYQYCAGIPKQCDFTLEVVEEFPKTDCIIQEINQHKKLMTCAIDSTYLEEKEYRNYIIGNGVGKKVNFNILLKMKDQYYKIKTLQAKMENEKIYLIGYVKNKYLMEDFEIFLRNNESQKVYQYIGGRK